MSSLFERLADVKAKLLGKPAVEAPVPFEVVCDCGHRVAGIRRKGYQIAECSACTSAIFILPADCYPKVKKPVAKEAPAPKRSVAGPASAPPNEPERDAALAGTSGESVSPEKRKQGGKSEPRKEAAPSDQEVILIDDDVIRLPRVPLTVRIRRVFTPVRLLGVASVVLVGLTAWWMIHQRTLEEARRTWRREMDTVKTAIEEGDRGSVATAIKKAVDAAIVLSRDDADARDAKSLLRQVQSVDAVKSSSSDPVSVLADVTAAKVNNVEDLRAILDRVNGICCVFESPLVRSTENEQILVLNSPLLTPSGRIRIQVDSELLRGFYGQVGQDNMLFIASVKDASRNQAGSGEWLINLDGRSVTLLTSELLASELGYDPKLIPETADILKRQLEFMRTDAAQRPEPEPEVEEKKK